TETANVDSYILALHDALPIWVWCERVKSGGKIKRKHRGKGNKEERKEERDIIFKCRPALSAGLPWPLISAAHRKLRLDPINMVKDRKSTRLNSSHVKISYAVF